MLHVENNNPPSHTSQEKLIGIGTSRFDVLHSRVNITPQEIVNHYTPIIQSYTQKAIGTLDFGINQELHHGVNFASRETIGRRGRGREQVVHRDTVGRHMKQFVKDGLLIKVYRPNKTCIYRMHPLLFAYREYFKHLLPSLKSLTIMLLLSCFTVNAVHTKYYGNTNTRKSLSFNYLKTVTRIENTDGTVYHTKKGLVMNVFPSYIDSITELNLTELGKIELSGFQEADVLFARKEMAKYKATLKNPFVWFLTVCRNSAKTHSRKIDWQLVSQMRQARGYDGTEEKYIKREQTSFEQSSSAMNDSNNKSSIRGKARDAAYQAYVPDERKPDEDPLVAAFKVAANCIVKNYYFGNPWYDKLTLEQKAALHAEYPTYAKLARIEPVLLGQGYEEHVVMPVDASKTLPAESLFKTEPYTLNVEEEPMWEEISEVISGMANFKSSPLDVNNLPTYTPETDEVDDLLNSYHPLPTRGRDISSQTHFKSVGSVIESLGTSLS